MRGARFPTVIEISGWGGGLISCTATAFRSKTENCLLTIGHFAVVYLVAKPLIWSEAEGDLAVIETSI